MVRIFSTVGGVSVLSTNVTCLSVFIRNYQIYQKIPVRSRSAGTLSWAARDPKDILHTPKNIHFSKNKKKKIIEIQNFESKNGPSLHMNENNRVTPPLSLGRRRSSDEHSRVDNV